MILSLNIHWRGNYVIAFALVELHFVRDMLKNSKKKKEREKGKKKKGKETEYHALS